MSEATKKLYILVSNGGDGSYNAKFIMDEAILNKLEAAADADEVDLEYCPGCDGDGFHYSTLTIPESCTPESLGIRLFDEEDLKYTLKK